MEESIITKLQTTIGRNIRINMKRSGSEIEIDIQESLNPTEISAVKNKISEIFPNMRLIEIGKN